MTGSFRSQVTVAQQDAAAARAVAKKAKADAERAMARVIAAEMQRDTAELNADRWQIARDRWHNNFNGVAQAVDSVFPGVADLAAEKVIGGMEVRDAWEAALLAIVGTGTGGA